MNFLFYIWNKRILISFSVMTSVYGVTFIGAKKQIQEKIEEKVRIIGVEYTQKRIIITKPQQYYLFFHV